MFKALIAMLLGSESAFETRKTYRQKRVEPQHIQDARIAAAQAKRARRLAKCHNDAATSSRNNFTHHPVEFDKSTGEYEQISKPRLNPFFINRSTTV